MSEQTKRRVDFKFSKNWKTFLSWYDAYYKKAGCAPMWEFQSKKIEECFEPTNPGVVDWKRVWKDLSVWYKSIMKEKSMVLWSEQKRQIETLMLKQLAELNTDQFILAFIHKGKPQVTEQMTYWEAIRLQGTLEGDSNGIGGNEDMDRINIININTLVK